MTKLKERIDATATRLAQLKNQQRLKDQAQAAREKKAKRREQAKALATLSRQEDAHQKMLSRQEDAHRKIKLGGLVIAAEVDAWDPSEIVGALLFMADRFRGQPPLLEQCREKGIKHMEAREEAQKAARQAAK
jgi:hypothetical protein